jgi:hypothetical protein
MKDLSPKSDTLTAALNLLVAIRGLLECWEKRAISPDHRTTGERTGDAKR